MNVVFVNKYTVAKEGHVLYHHLRPEMRRPAPAPEPEESPGRGKVNSAVRIVGLAIAIGIILLSILGRMFAFAVIGCILAGIYGIRIHEKRKSKARKRERPPAMPQIPEGDSAGRWVRFVRFGDHIEVEDPGKTSEYQYSQITRISDDPAYITLWMDNGSQVRVAKNGFTIGTLESFEQFIMDKTNRMIGPKAAQPEA